MKKATYQLFAGKLLLKSLALFVSLFVVNSARAQSVQCPPNLDFELGNFTNWNASVGLASSGSGGTGVQYTSIVNSGPLPGRHELVQYVNPGDTDFYGGFPNVPNGGGSYALKLGKDSALYASERVRYYVHVPVGFNDYSFNYRYAVVLQDPGHGLDDQPAMRIVAYDSAQAATTGVITPLPCSKQDYIASPALLQFGFKNSPRSQAYDTIRYLPWTGGAIPIIGQGGKTIVVEVTALGCGAGGHWGYGYFDVISCGQFKAAVAYCNLDSGIVRFIGTGITQNYNWYDDNWTYIGQGPYIDVNLTSTTPHFYYGVLANGSPGCLDTIKTDSVANFLVDAQPANTCAVFGVPFQITTGVNGGIPPFNFNWNASPDLSALNIDNPIASPIDTTRYVVTVTDRVGCFRRDTIQVTQAPNAGPDLKVCPLGERPAQLHVAGPDGVTFHWYELGGDNPGQYLDCTDCQDPTSAPLVPSYTYTVGYEGCPQRDTITVYHDTSNYIVAPQDLLLVCRPTYQQLLSQAFGPNPMANIPCGTGNPITCNPADQDTATVGVVGTPAKKPSNTPFLSTHVFHKYQFIVKKSELLYSGLYSGTINSMALRTLATTIAAKNDLANVTVSLGCIDKDDFPRPINNNSFYQGLQLTEVANTTSYALTADAWNEIPFHSPYSWDTSKNLVVDICVGPLSLLDTFYQGFDPVSMTEGRAIQKVSNGINVCGGNAPTVTEYQQRPVVQFYYCPTPELPFDYTWEPGNNLNDSNVQNPVAYIPRSINYAVYSVGRNGCKLRDSLHIYVPEHNVLAGPIDTFICQGQPAFLFASGGEAYKWYEVREGAFADASGSLNCTDCATPIATPKQTTTYAIVFSNETTVGNPENPGYGIGCPDTLFITVNVWTLPNVNILNRDTTITIGQSVPLYVQGAQTFSWSPVGSLSNPNAPMTIATPTATTNYIATGFDVNGCAYRDTVKVTVKYHGNLLIPTGFTPNGDGMNDVFKIVNPRVQALMEFRVFNRWGQEVFTTTNINKGWDGTWKGVPQEIGTYQYIIRVGYADGQTELYKGDVQLIR